MKRLSILYTSLLACLTTSTLSAVTTAPSAATISTAIDPEDGPKINETYILKTTTNPNASNLTIPRHPIWVYPAGTDLALKFWEFGTVTPMQELQAFAVLAIALEAARSHANYEEIVATQSYRWGAGVPMVVDILPITPYRLLWGDALDILIAMQIFLSTNPCTAHVSIHENDEDVRYLGELILMVSTSTVSGS